MTREEAISILELDASLTYDVTSKEAYNVAIESLKTNVNKSCDGCMYEDTREINETCEWCIRRGKDNYITSEEYWKGWEEE